jgi:hypothetical protein
MKKHILSACLFVLLLMGAVSANAQGNGNSNANPNGNENYYIGRAIGAFNGGCAGHTGPLNGQVETIGICFVSGFITRVILTPQINCHQVDCDLIRIAPVGYVDFDCEGNVMSVSCTWP